MRWFLVVGIADSSQLPLTSAAVIGRAIGELRVRADLQRPDREIGIRRPFGQDIGLDLALVVEIHRTCVPERVPAKRHAAAAQGRPVLIEGGVDRLQHLALLRHHDPRARPEGRNRDDRTDPELQQAPAADARLAFRPFHVFLPEVSHAVARPSRLETKQTTSVTGLSTCYFRPDKLGGGPWLGREILPEKLYTKSMFYAKIMKRRAKILA